MQIDQFYLNRRIETAKREQSRQNPQKPAAPGYHINRYQGPTPWCISALPAVPGRRQGGRQETEVFCPGWEQSAKTAVLLITGAEAPGVQEAARLPERGDNQPDKALIYRFFRKCVHKKRTIKISLHFKRVTNRKNFIAKLWKNSCI